MLLWKLDDGLSSEDTDHVSQLSTINKNPRKVFEQVTKPVFVESLTQWRNVFRPRQLLSDKQDVQYNVLQVARFFER